MASPSARTTGPGDVPFFSIIVPFHNGASYLGAAIDSVWRQVFTSWELHLVDDASTDQGPALAEQAAAQDPERVFVHRTQQPQRRGPAAARNVGIRHARGTWLAFLDSDDVFLPSRLAVHHAAIQQRDVVLIHGRVENVDAEGRALGATALHPNPVWGGPAAPGTALVDAHILGDAWLPLLAVSVKTDVMRSVGGFPEGLHAQVEDYVAWGRVLREGASWYTPEVVAQYRVHAASWTSRRSADSVARDRMEGLRELAKTQVDEPVIALAALRVLGMAIGGHASPSNLLTVARAAHSLGWGRVGWRRAVPAARQFVRGLRHGHQLVS